jgi:hypothetical protein
MTLKGFKSFASATTLRLEPGITCVVALMVPENQMSSMLLPGLWVSRVRNHCVAARWKMSSLLEQVDVHR